MKKGVGNWWGIRKGLKKETNCNITLQDDYKLYELQTYINTKVQYTSLSSILLVMFIRSSAVFLCLFTWLVLDREQFVKISGYECISVYFSWILLQFLLYKQLLFDTKISLRNFCCNSWFAFIKCPFLKMFFFLNISLSDNRTVIIVFYYFSFVQCVFSHPFIFGVFEQFCLNNFIEI